MGEDLVINGDYLANGVRERASELATLELGPVTEIEQRRKLTAEIDQDRFTRIDRAMVNEAAEDGRLDLRHAPENMRGQEDRDAPAAPSWQAGEAGPRQPNSHRASGNLVIAWSRPCATWASAATSCVPCRRRCEPRAMTAIR